jgi:hypothetical protein
MLPFEHSNELIRRTSILYDTDKIKPPHLPPPNYRPPINNSPIESSAADTLMSMAQQKEYSSKRPLEMADSEEDEEKRIRLESPKKPALTKTGISVS